MTISASWPTTYGLKHFAEIDSTNEEARRLAASGVTGPLWLYADRQTLGRGRRGNKWVSPQGNLAATLLLQPQRPTAECAQLSFVAALAVSDTVGRLLPYVDVRVKWPNDVLVNDRKIAGILLESAQGRGAHPDWLAVGIGLNLAASPRGVDIEATSVAEAGAQAPSALEALTLLAQFWAEWYDTWSARGFGPVRDAWVARAARLGARIRARLPKGEAVGVFEGIDQSGALILRESHGRTRSIPAGEIYF